MFHPQGPTFWELAQQAFSSTERGYDLLAPKFDFTPFRTSDEILDATRPFVGEVESINAALDICCGTGAAMKMLRPLCHRVVGIDMSVGMLEEAKKQASDTADSTHLEFVHGNVLDIPFKAEFDVAVCFGALGHILPKDEERFVEQIAKALKPGGRFLFVTTEMPSLVSFQYWAARSFNTALHLRNILLSPPFIMFYLTFLLPQAKYLLESHNFNVKIHSDLFSCRFKSLKLVVGTLKEK